MEEEENNARPKHKNCYLACLNSWKFYFGQGCLETKSRTCGYIWGFLRFEVYLLRMYNILYIFFIILIYYVSIFVLIHF